MIRRLAIAALICLAGPVSAQVVVAPNCAAPDLPPPDVAACAAQVFETAEAELDATYRLALTRAQAFDQQTAVEGIEVSLGVEEALRAAQDAWLAYREATCDAEAALLRNGTGAPVAGTVCRARLDLERTEALRAFAPDL